MDNHADNLVINKNYLAGLVDSDFGVCIKRFYPRGKLQLRPDINFSNTRFNLISLVSEVLHSKGINHYVGLHKATVGKDKKYVSINRFSKCVEFIEFISSYCVVRKPQLDVLYKFCNDRLKYVNECGWKQNNTPYTDYQKELFETMVELNLNYNRDEGSRNNTFSWLGGFTDGDGSIGFITTTSKSKHKNVDGSFKLYCNKRILPFVNYTSGSDSAKNNIISMLESNGIKYVLSSKKSKAKKRIGKNKHKVYYSVDIRGFDDVDKLLVLLEDKVVAKNDQLKLVRKYIDIRRSTPHYTDECFEIVKAVKDLNVNY